MCPSPPRETDPDRLQPPWPLVILGAWLLPGLGHWLIGQRGRGLILCHTIIGLFIAGLLLCGIDVVDRREDTLWYALGQIHVGPLAIAVAEIHAHLDRRASASAAGLSGFGPPPPAPSRPYQRSIGRINELGTLYCAVAGGLNLLVILDLLGRLTGQGAAGRAGG